MGSQSDFSVGVGTAPFSSSADLSAVPTQGLRAGDFAFVRNVGVTQWWAFDPSSTKATDADTVLADIALNNAVNAGRWRRTTAAFG